MSWIGISPRIRPTADIHRIAVPQLLNDQILGFGNALFNVRAHIFFILQDTRPTSLLAQFGTNTEGLPAVPAAVGRSLTVMFSAKPSSDGIERFFVFTGGHPNSTTITGGINRETTVEMELWFKDLQINQLPPAGTVFAVDPRTPPISFYDGGPQPVTLGNRTPDVYEISVTVQKNLTAIQQLPDIGVSRSLVREFAPGLRKTTGLLKLPWTGIQNYQDLIINAKNTLTWTLKQNGANVTVTTCLLRRLEDFSAKTIGSKLETLFETYSFTGIGTVTA
jgi:hypothetical protein